VRGGGTLMYILFMEATVVRKPGVRKTVRRVAAPKSAPTRTRAVRSSSVSAPLRKAPPREIAEATGRVAKRAGRRPLFIIGTASFLFLMLFGMSALIGLSDKGQLDVSSKIAARKAGASEEEKKELESVPTDQSFSALPNGGLVGMGSPEPSPEPPSVPDTASSTASTTTDSTTENQVAPEPETPEDSPTPTPETPVGETASAP
jgi:hypothetical protein